MARTIPLALTPYGIDRLSTFQEEYGPYRYTENHPQLYALLDSIDAVGFLPETSISEIQYLEDFNYAQRLS